MPETSQMKTGRARPRNSRATAAARTRIGVIVLGMHRSGTSALTRALNLLGCSLPATLMGPYEGNPLGHWESDSVMSFNDSLLDSAGSNWMDWTPIGSNWYQSPARDEFAERAGELLRQEFGKSRLFVLKDPRICRLVPFWLSVFDEEGISPRIVTPVRNPLEVAQSLHRRDGMDTEYGLQLWLRHVLDAEHATRGRQRAFTSYDLLLTNWSSLATRLQADLAVSWPKTSPLSAEDINGFLSQDLRHHSVLPAAVIDNPAVSPWVRRTYEVLHDWCVKGEKPTDFDELDRIREAIDATVPALGGLVLRSVRASLNVSKLQADLASAEEKNASLSTVENERAAVEAERAALQERVTAVEAALHQSEERVAQMSTLEAERAAVEAERTALQERVAAVEAALRQSEERVAQMSTLEAERAAAEAERTALQERVTAVEAALRQSEERVAQMSTLEAERATVEAERAELQARVATVEAALYESQRRHDELMLSLGDSAAQLDAEQQARHRREVELQGQLAAIGEEHRAALAQAPDPALVENLQSEIARLTGDIESLRVHCASLEQETSNASQRAESLNAERTALEQRITELTAQQSQHANSVDLLVQNFESARQRAEAAEAEKRAFEDQVRLLQAQEATHIESLAASHQQLADVESRLRQREEEAEQAWRALQEQKELGAELEAAIAQGADQAKLLQKRLTESESWVFKLAGDLRNAQEAVVSANLDRKAALRAISKSDDRIKQLEAKLANTLASDEASRSKLEDAESRLHALEQSAARAERLADQLAVRSSEYEELARSHRALKDAAAENGRRLTESQVEISQLTIELRRREETLQNAVKDSELRVRQAREQIGALNAQLAARATELENARTQQADAVARLGDTEGRLAERFNEISTLSRMVGVRERDASQQSAHVDWLRQVHATLNQAPTWWRLMPQGWRRQREFGRLARRGLFDHEAYLKLHADVASSGIDPLWHYIMHGISEGRALGVTSDRN